LSEVGRTIVKRAYADWSKELKVHDDMQRLGIEPIHLFRSPSGKNASDIRLAIDAIDLMYQSPVDTFVVVSADSDFVPLISRLRSSCKTVFGAGRRAAVSQTLIHSCDRFFYLEEASKTPKSKPAAPKSLLARAMHAAQDEEGKVLGSKLRDTLQRLDPSFNFRDQGFSTFSKYLEAQPGIGLTRTPGASDVTVVSGTALIDERGNGWERLIDRNWSDRARKSGGSIGGRTAAADAAKALGVSKLADSTQPTLQKLLDNSKYLASRWRREGNKIKRI
jgi:uncharacterized protein (TIGR00288 family)